MTLLAFFIYSFLLPRPSSFEPSRVTTEKAQTLYTDQNGVSFFFRGQFFQFEAPLQLHQKGSVFQRGGMTREAVDTSSHWFCPAKMWVEIIRQDEALNPHIGLALSFEFDETNGEYPYTPARSALQLKDYRWGGKEFAPNDTLNFSGVSNAVSDDIQIEVDGYENDTIYGRFSGLLLNGAGQMRAIDSGYFRVMVYRIE